MVFTIGLGDAIWSGRIPGASFFIMMIVIIKSSPETIKQICFLLNYEVNNISDNLIRLRREHKLSQRDLAKLMQLAGCDMDRNVITRIETQKRYVTDIELKKLCQVLDTTFEELTRDVAPEGSKT